MIKRKSIEYIKHNTGQPLLGIEVGVYKGENAVNILNNLNIEKLYLVDPYLPYCDYNPLDLPTPLDLAKKKAYQETKDFPTSHIYKKFHECTSSDFDNKMFDFIYIDGEHSEDAFRIDFNHALKLVKPDMILCGHDANFPQIKKVLDASGYTVTIFDNPFGEGTDWLIDLSDGH